jgi:MerR family transcriptional regulator, light-induced transcriptional regulator
VSDFCEIEGWDTSYLGANMPTPGILDMLVQRRAHVLALSATMTFHVRAVADVIKAVRAAKACCDVKILVGGYPFNVASTASPFSQVHNTGSSPKQLNKGI